MLLQLNLKTSEVEYVPATQEAQVFESSAPIDKWAIKEQIDYVSVFSHIETHDRFCYLSLSQPKPVQIVSAQ